METEKPFDMDQDAWIQDAKRVFETHGFDPISADLGVRWGVAWYQYISTEVNEYSVTGKPEADIDFGKLTEEGLQNSFGQLQEDGRERGLMVGNIASPVICKLAEMTFTLAFGPHTETAKNLLLKRKEYIRTQPTMVKSTFRTQQ